MTLPGGLTQSDVVAWYAARLDPGAADGSGVPVLPDVSGNGQDISQGTAAKRFVHRANHYGTLSTWQANLSCYKKQWGFNVSEPYTVLAVVEVTSLLIDTCIFSGFSKTQKHMTGIDKGSPDRFVMEQEGTGQHIYGGSPSTNQLYVLRSEYAGVDRLYVNGALTIEGDAGHDFSIGATIACRENEQRHVAGFYSEWGMLTNVAQGETVEADLISIFGV